MRADSEWSSRAPQATGKLNKLTRSLSERLNMIIIIVVNNSLPMCERSAYVRNVDENGSSSERASYAA